MKIREIVAPLEEFAPLALQEHYDNAGLIVGDPDNEADAALVCVDVTEAVLEEAVERGAGTGHCPPSAGVPSAQAAFAHHLYRTGRAAGRPRRHRRLCLSHQSGQRASGDELCTGAPVGSAGDGAADPLRAAAGAGFGVVGRPECEMPTEAFLRMVRERLGTGAIRHSALVRETVRRVALCTGGGRFDDGRCASQRGRPLHLGRFPLQRLSGCRQRSGYRRCGPF